MAPARYRALSLDLWFTSLYYADPAESAWDRARAEALAELIRGPGGATYSVAEIERAIPTFHERARAAGRPAIVQDPSDHVAGVAEVLGGSIVGPKEEAGRRYSRAGIAAVPPLANPEATRVARALRARGVPVIAITNTARRAETWREHLPRWDGPEFDAILTSCEVGSAKPAPGLFVEAARRLGLPPADILHVGDRPELDLDGARAGGFGAALYRGLWNRYPERLYPNGSGVPTELGPGDREVAIDRLEELLEPARFEWVPSGPGRARTATPT